MPRNHGLTMAKGMVMYLVNHGLTRPQTMAKPINKIKRNKRVREVSYASRFTHPYVNLSSSSFFGSFFVENSWQVAHGSA